VLFLVVQLYELVAESREFEEIVLFIDSLGLELGMDGTTAVHKLGFCLGLFATDAIFGFVVLFIDEAVPLYLLPEFLGCFLMVRIRRADEMDTFA
jgi:hypothetical protein